MLGEIQQATTATTASLPPRAAIAVLTLQLRASLQEAAAAESEELAIDPELAIAQLRAKLDPLVEERRRTLDAELDEARRDAAAAVSAAQERAAAIVAERRAAKDLATAMFDEPTPVVEPTSVADPVPGLIDAIRAALDAPAADPEPLPPIVEAQPLLADVLPPAVPERPVLDEPPATPEPPATADAHRIQPTTITIDADAFARVFAAVFATLLDERMAGWGQTMSARPLYAPLPSAQPAPVKQSFWAHARHPDVLLMGLAMVVVLVVLAAWMA